jgi:RHS repeat-associated protein
MDFLYDESGNAYSFVYNGTQYYYVRNLQGDVVKILNTSGGVVASYTYDAWGKVTNSGNVVGQYNPIRYRGYYYDTDTGFYYLQSRYYDPAIKRFISADDASLLGANGDFASLNLYAYCGNNPVSRSDDGGEAWHILIGAGVGAISSFVASVATQFITEKGQIDWNTAWISAGYGAITGALVAACPSAAPYINGAMSVVESLVDDCLLSSEKVSPKEVVSNAAISGTFGLITGTWDNDIVDNKALINNSVHSLKNVLFSGVNPTVRKTSNKLVRKFNRFIVKTSWNSAKETVGISFLTEGTKQIANVIPWGV